jgi:Cytochrome c oxidase subunit IV
MIRLPEEVLVFARLAAFGLIVGTVYWFVAYEAAGTVLLLGFGIATAVAAIILWVRSRKIAGATDHGLLATDPGPIPAPAYAPFHIGVGAGLVALGLAFSPLLVLTGLVVMVIGARYWLEAAMREADSVAARDRRGGPPS